MARRKPADFRSLRRFGPVLVLLGACACASATGGVQAPGKAEARDPASLMFERGRTAAEQGDSVRAEQYITLAIDRGYDAGKALPLLLKVCLASSRLRAALDHAEPYLRDHPEAEPLRYLVATIHAGLGQTEEAQLELQQLLRANPNSLDAHYLLGIIESNSDPASARAHFHSYLDTDSRGEHASEVRSRLAELAIRGERSPVDVSAANDSDNKQWFDLRGPRAVHAPGTSGGRQ